MTAPTRKLRELVYTRDHHRCLDCGSSSLTIQHREASGAGGRGSKAPQLTAADIITLCGPCNAACEAHGQERALHMGWKLRRNRGQMRASEIPVYDRNTHDWLLLTEDGDTAWIGASLAAELLGVAGNLTMKGVAPYAAPVERERDRVRIDEEGTNHGR